MPRISDKERVKTWNSKVESSCRQYDKWAKKFACSQLEEYYYGFQWPDDEQENRRRYVINLFYPSINIRKPSLLFDKPRYTVKPVPGIADDPGTDIDLRARMQEDTLNTFVADPKIAFRMETGLCLLDAQFRFGVIEVGYTADFIDNPNADKPLLSTTTGNPLIDSSGEEVRQPKKLLKQESLFVKHIPASTFRVSVNNSNRMESCDWVGYYEWHYPSDLQANPRYKNTGNLKPTGKMQDVKEPDYESEDPSSKDPDASNHRNMVKIWKIWDLRSKNRIVIADGCDKFLLEEPYKFLPFSVLKFDERINEFYPLPFSFNWLSPQNELNETREMQRIHRKRFIRKFQAAGDAFVTPEEKAKWEEGEDGALISVTRDGAIQPIQDAPLDPAIVRNIPLTKEDFREISGVSGEERGIADADTATQARIIQLQSTVRSAAGRLQVANWLGDIGRLMLLTIREYMALPFWIQRNVDPFAPDAEQQVIKTAVLWNQITSESLGEIDEVSVELESLSPAAEEAERNSWVQLMTIVTNPSLQLLLASSEVLLRKTAGYFGVRNERELREIQKALMTATMAQMAPAASNALSPGQPSGAAEPGPVPSQEGIDNQLNQQLPV